MNYLAIIPARGGSKGVPRKNLRPLAGAPLLAWSIRQALACPAIGRVIVSTDSEEIRATALAEGAEVPGLRPRELATDAAATDPVLIDVVRRWACDPLPDAVILLQPTSPIRHPDSLPNACRLFETSGADSLVSVCRSHAFFWRNPANPLASYDYLKRPRRQDIPPEETQFRENGSIYITKTQTLLDLGSRLGGKIALFEMTEEESVEIDSEVDFLITESLFSLNAQGNEGPPRGSLPPLGYAAGGRECSHDH